MSAKISKCGQMREFLTNMMVGLKDGDVKVDEAKTMVKLAEKVNENYYAELKVAQVHLQLGREVSKLGELPINT